MNRDGRQRPVLKSALNPQSPTYLANRKNGRNAWKKFRRRLLNPARGEKRTTPDTRAGETFARSIEYLLDRDSYFLNCARSLDTESEGPQPAEASWAVSDKSRAWTV